MADVKNTGAPKVNAGAPVTPKVQTPPVPPAAPASPTAPAPASQTAPAKAKREKKPLYYATENEAMVEAGSRTEGARRPFKVTYDGKDYFLVVHNWEQAVANVAKDHGGATFQELGKTAKAPAEATGASIAAMLSKLSDEDRRQVEEALAKLKK